MELVSDKVISLSKERALRDKNTLIENAKYLVFDSGEILIFDELIKHETAAFNFKKKLNLSSKPIYGGFVTCGRTRSIYSIALIGNSFTCKVSTPTDTATVRNLELRISTRDYYGKIGKPYSYEPVKG